MRSSAVVAGGGADAAMFYKVMRLGVVPASLSLLPLQVYASSSENETPKKEFLKTNELSLYSCPSRESKYVEKPQTQLEEGISYVRRSVEPYTAWCQDLYSKAMPRVERTVERGRENCEFLKNPPPGFYPRLGVIGFAGIVGLFLSRGSKIKRLVYPVGFMGIGASLYYPQQAVAIAKAVSMLGLHTMKADTFLLPRSLQSKLDINWVTGSRLYDWSLQGYVAVESLWKDSPKKKKSGKKTSDKSEADNEKPVEVHVNSGEERTMK